MESDLRAAARHPTNFRGSGFSSRRLGGGYLDCPFIDDPFARRTQPDCPAPDSTFGSSSNSRSWVACGVETICDLRSKGLGVPMGTPILVLIESSSESTAAQDRDASAGRDDATPVSDWIVDRFISYAASVNPDPTDLTFLFKLDRAKSRLDQEWIAEAAKQFAIKWKDT